MKRSPSTPDEPEPLDLGPDGEAQFERLRACLELGQGVEIYFCGFDAPACLAEVKRRLATAPPPGTEFNSLPLDEPDALEALPDRLSALPLGAAGRKIIFAGAPGLEDDLKGSWARGLRRLNEQRNSTMRQCPNAILLAGPSWLPWLAHDVAPDLWSVRTAIFSFPTPPALSDGSAAPAIEPWPTGLPMAHELQAPEYYEELAGALEGSRRPGEQETRGRLLLYASAAWKLHGDYDHALMAAREAGVIFASESDEHMVAISKGYVADVLVLRGEIDEALRIRREEELPVFERLGDVRSRAVTMGKIADNLQERGETEEALRIWRKEVLPVMENLGDVRDRAAVMGRIATTLQGRGEADEALRIYREELIPVFESLGDIRGRATTMSRIAEVLRKLGRDDEALRILIEDCLPVAEKMGEIQAMASIRFGCALIRVERGGLEKGEAQTIRDELTESLVLNRKLQSIRGIAYTGLLLGQVLVAVGDVEEALTVLDESAAAFDRLGFAHRTEQARELQESIRIRTK